MCKFESKERGRRGTMWQFESKEVCESLCFHSKSECAGCRKLVVWDAVCGAVPARSRVVPRVIEGIAFLWNFGVRSSIGGSNCRSLDALAGEFRGCGKASNARQIIGECNCRVSDALAGEFRGCGQGSNARRIIGECNLNNSVTWQAWDNVQGWKYRTWQAWDNVAV